MKIVLLVILSIFIFSCNKNGDGNKIGSGEGVQVYPVPSNADNSINIDTSRFSSEAKAQISKLTTDGYKPFYKETYIQDKQTKLILVFSKGMGDCNANSTNKIGGIVLSNSDVKDQTSLWQLEAESDSIIQIGERDINPDVKLAHIGTNNFALVFSSSHVSQRFRNNRVLFIAIRDHGFENILDGSGGEDNTDTGEAVSSYVVALNIIPSNKEFYDVGIKVSGKGNFKQYWRKGDTTDVLINACRHDCKSLSYKNGKYL